MLLRASSEIQDQGVNLQGLVSATDTGVIAGAALTAFADAVVQGDAEAIGRARDTVTAELGEAAMVDAAAVIANFQRMVRIADGTGIPLDEPVLMMTQNIRQDLGIDEYSASAHSPQLPVFKRLLGKLLAPVAPRLLKRLAGKRVAPR